MKQKSLFSALCLAVSLIIAVGSVSFLGPCVHEDGSFGVCHWAGRMMLGIGILLAVLSALSLAVKKDALRQGIFLAMLPTALLGFFTPGTLISLCSMASMRCRSVMQPAMRLLCVLVMILSAVALLLSRDRGNEKG